MDLDRTAIGFRGYVDGFSYVCLSGTQERPTVVECDRLVFPARQRDARALCWLRKQVQELLEAHEVSSACVKTIEPVAGADALGPAAS